MGLQEGGEGAWNKGVLQGEAARGFAQGSTQATAERTRGKRGRCLTGGQNRVQTGWKKEGAPPPSRRRAEVQIKSASGWLPWDTGERDNPNTEVYRDGGEGKNEAGSPLSANQGRRQTAVLGPPWAKRRGQGSRSNDGLFETPREVRGKPLLQDPGPGPSEGPTCESPPGRSTPRRAPASPAGPSAGPVARPPPPPPQCSYLHTCPICSRWMTDCQIHTERRHRRCAPGVAVPTAPGPPRAAPWP